MINDDVSCNNSYIKLDKDCPSDGKFLKSCQNLTAGQTYQYGLTCLL